MQTTRTISREESKLITRNRLLQSTTSLLREKEQSAITISEIAGGAGVTQPAFYRHFDNKSDCIREAIEAEVARIRQQLKNSREEAGQQKYGFDLMVELMRRAFLVFSEQGQGIRLVLREMRAPSSSAVPSFIKIRGELIDDMVQDVLKLSNTLGIEYDIDYLKLVAEGLSGLGESFVLAYIDEDLKDLDAIIAVLAKYLQATLPELFEPAA